MSAPDDRLADPETGARLRFAAIVVEHEQRKWAALAHALAVLQRAAAVSAGSSGRGERPSPSGVSQATPNWDARQ